MVLHVKNSSPICMTLCWLWTDTFLTSCSLHCPEFFTKTVASIFCLRHIFQSSLGFMTCMVLTNSNPRGLLHVMNFGLNILWVRLTQSPFPSFCLAFPTGGSSERWGEMLWIRSPTMSYWSEYLSLKQLMCVVVFGSHRMVKNIKWRNLLPN